MSLQKQMIKFINVARQHPTYFVSLVQKQINSFTNDRQIPLNDDIIYETNEGKKVWIETLAFLKQQKPIPSLQEHQGLNLSAKDHVIDLVNNNIFGHTGSDGSTFSERILKYCRKGHGSMAQLIGADFDFQNRNHAEMTVLGLIIDDGVPDRGHRKTIFNPLYQFFGCKCEVQGQKIITVFNITENKLALRSQSSFQSTGSSFQSKSPIQSLQSTQKSTKNQKKTEDRFCKTQSGQKKQGEKNSWNSKTPLEDSLNKMKITSGPKGDTFSASSDTFRKTDPFKDTNDFKQSSSKASKNSQNSQNRKICEKKQSSKVYYEEGSKITETTITFIYNDGTVQEKVDRHTVYLQA